MTETKRGRGRPRGSGLDSLSEFDRAEAVESQLDTLIELRATTSTENGFEADVEIASRRFKERSREEHRGQWCAHHRRMVTLFRALADEHEKKLQKLLRGPETLGETGGSNS